MNVTERLFGGGYTMTNGTTERREIFAKAVCGKGRKFSHASHTITPSRIPTNVLGCWIINHSYKAHKVGEVVEVVGSYDVNVWYSYDKNTKTEVAKETISYVDQVPLSYLDKNTTGDSWDVRAVATQAPNAIEANVSHREDSVVVKVERGFAVEVIGETRLVVLTTESDDLDDKGYDFDDEGGDDAYEDLDADLYIDDLD